MSQLILKPSIFKNVIRHTNSVRMFSSTPTYPFMLIDYLLNVPFSPDDDALATRWSIRNLPDICKQKTILISDKKLRKEFTNAMTCGFTHNGLLRIQETTGDDNSLSIVIEHNKHSKVCLPPLPSGSKILNIAMSSLPDRDEDWAVCVKLQGSRLSLCRPFGNSEWIYINDMPESINPLSSLMFSKKDQKFYVPSPGGKNLFALDLHFKRADQPQFVCLWFNQLPTSVVSELEDLSSCSKTDHLVESPTGEIFLLKWYGEDVENSNSDLVVTSLLHKTQQFMVFREVEKENEEHNKTMIYTEDIGDLCIFVGHSQARCVPASSSPGLRPNCIYFVGYSFGVYDLTTKTCTTFLETDSLPFRNLEFPYWPPPVPLC